MNSLQSLRELIERLPARLQALESDKVEHKPAPESWSAKEELGHLLDSAANNYQRIVRAQLEEHPAMPSYDGEGWVGLQRYQEREWPALISLWVALNEQLLAAMEVAPESARSRTLTIGDSAPLTLQFVFDDYVDHMLHHLQHMGVEVEDLAPAKAAGRY
ncbi:MAG TPA: DinB family protein [Bryocella sp.]|nr:DinB family protein [Bryocella sp.]